MQDHSNRRLRSATIRFSPQLRLTFGEKLIILYFIVFYFLPMITDFFIDTPIKYFLQGDLQFLGAFLFSAGYLLLFLLIRKTVNLNLKLRFPLRGRVASPWVITFIFLLFLVFAARFSIQFSSSFRHTESYSSAGLIPMLTFVLKTICSIFIFASISSKRLVKLKWYHFTIYLIAIPLSFVGSYDIVYFVTATYAWLRYSRVSVVNFIRSLFSKTGGILMVLIIPIVVFSGMANKIGFEGAIEFFSEGGLSAGLELFANRTFYHSYSLAFQLNNYLGTFELGFEAFNIVSFQTFRRFLVLLGSDVTNQTLSTVNRLNFLVISGNNIYSDAGASPGLLGSIFYLPGGIYLLPIHMICVYNAISIFDNIMGKAKYGLPAYLCGIVMLQALVDAFVDRFNPFSIGFIALVTLFIMSSYARTIQDPTDPQR